MENKILLCITTTDSEQKAKEIARILVSNGYAACVSITKSTSFYKWKEKLVEDKEFLLLIKSSLDNRNLLEDKIKELHNYELPEILFLEVSSSDDYYSWLKRLVNSNF